MACTAAWAVQPAERDERIRLASGLSLSRLVDLAARQNNVDIEYDEGRELERVVTLRVSGELRGAEIWDLCLATLHRYGLTVVRANERDAMFAVVAIGEARGEVIAGDRFEGGGVSPGFQSVVVPLEFADAGAVVRDVESLLGSGEKFAIAAVSGRAAVVLTGLSDRVRHAMDRIEEIDRREVVPVVTRIHLQHREAVGVVDDIKELLESVVGQGGRPLRSDLSADASGAFVQVVGPPAEVEQVRALVRDADIPARTYTRSFTVGGLPLQTLGPFIETVARDHTAKGSGTRWGVIVDELTSTIVVTGTEDELARVASALDEIDDAPTGGAAVIKMIPVRNRDARQIVEVAAGLLGAYRFGESGGSENPIRAGRDLNSRETRTDVRFVDRRETRDQGEGRLDLSIDEEMNTIIARGTAIRVAQLQELVARLDVRQPQVELEVVLLSLSESDSFDLGIELAGNIDTGDTLVGLGSLFGLSALSPSDTSVEASGTGGTALVLSPGDFSAVVRAIQTINDGRSVSRPSIVVNNNESATLSSTVTQPFTTTTISDSNITTSRGGSASAGTTITVSPQIAAGDHIVLDYSVSLSSFVGEASSDGVEPPSQQTALDSVATIPDGYTIALGGIEITSEGASDTRTPWLADIPVIGGLFRSESDSSSASRFYVFIRASVMRSPDFERLKYVSERTAAEAEVDSGWPTVAPRWIE